MNWINILHFYQPPTTSNEIIKEVVKSSYQSWVGFLNKYRQIKITANFTACLTERLFNSGYQKLLKDLAKIATRGQIELVESAAFHPILPLLPEKEIIKQIKINKQINKLRFGKVYHPQGFFLPEMAYSEKVAKIIKKLGYKYIILDEIAYSTNGHEFKTNLNESRINTNVKYKIKKISARGGSAFGRGLNVVFRNRKISQTFVPETIINIMEGRDKSISVNQCSHQCSSVYNIITATDAELYGHRYWNWYPAYSHLVKNKEIKTLTVSEYLKSLKQEKIIQPVACSWESTLTELKHNIPYALWSHPRNKIHQKLWQLANLALQLNWGHLKDPNHFASRLHLEKGLASCTFWWASGRDLKLFSPAAWHPTQVEVGAQELLSSIRSLEKINTKSKLAAEKLFSQIRNLIWRKHWRK